MVANRFFADHVVFEQHEKNVTFSNNRELNFRLMGSPAFKKSMLNNIKGAVPGLGAELEKIVFLSGFSNPTAYMKSDFQRIDREIEQAAVVALQKSDATRTTEDYAFLAASVFVVQELEVRRLTNVNKGPVTEYEDKKVGPHQPQPVFTQKLKAATQPVDEVILPPPSPEPKFSASFEPPAPPPAPAHSPVPPVSPVGQQNSESSSGVGQAFKTAAAALLLPVAWGVFGRYTSLDTSYGPAFAAVEFIGLWALSASVLNGFRLPKQEDNSELANKKIDLQKKKIDLAKERIDLEKENLGLEQSVLELNNAIAGLTALKQAQQSTVQAKPTRRNKQKAEETKPVQEADTPEILQLRFTQAEKKRQQMDAARKKLDIDKREKDIEKEEKELEKDKRSVTMSAHARVAKHAFWTIAVTMGALWGVHFAVQKDMLPAQDGFVATADKLSVHAGSEAQTILVAAPAEAPYQAPGQFDGGSPSHGMIKVSRDSFTYYRDKSLAAPLHEGDMVCVTAARLHKASGVYAVELALPGQTEPVYVRNTDLTGHADGSNCAVDARAQPIRGNYRSNSASSGPGGAG